MRFFILKFEVIFMLLFVVRFCCVIVDVVVVMEIFMFEVDVFVRENFLV